MASNLEGLNLSEIEEVMSDNFGVKVLDMFRDIGAESFPQFSPNM